MRVIVDGRAIEVPEGATALQALRIAGLDVPTACHDPRLKPSGACRLCLVRVNGSNRPVASCAMPVSEGMEIVVDSEELVEARRAELAMLAREYPPEEILALPEKTFHQWLTKYGLKAEGKRDESKIDATNPYFRFDPSACIRCYRCVRICDEVQGSFVWHVHDRASDSHVAPDSMGTLAESSCRSCGACVDACPTSALVDKTRIEEGAPERWTRTTCPYCGVGCELSVGTIGNRVVQVLPVLDAPVNKGHLCVKGRYAHAYIHSEDRITTPLIRKDGELVPATWDEALDRVASEFKRTLDEHGPNAIGVLGSARAPNEDNYLAQKFARVVIGTNNVDCCARVCHGPTAAAMKAMLGTGAATNSYDDIELARCFLVIGCNPTENHPIVGERVLQAVRQGARLIVIDPRRIDLADHADVHLPIKPGSNVPLLNAMAHVIFAEGLADRAFLASRTEDALEFEEFVREWTPERAAEICGVGADAIRSAARLYAKSAPTMSLHGLGMTEHLQGTEGVMCLVNLALITGNMGRRGSGINPLRGQNNVQGSAHMGCEPSNLTGFVSIPDGKARFEAAWNVSLPVTPGMNLVQMLDAAEAGKFKALWAIGYDVVFTNASAQRTRRQFEAMDFVVVQDLFLNETAREFADVFLPAASSFEREGTFMNAERRVQRVRASLEPIGDCKADWEIIQLVAQRMGHSQGFSLNSAEDVWNEVRTVWLPGAGMSYARLDERGLQWPCPSEDHPGTEVLHTKSFPLGDRALLKQIDYVPTPEITTPEYPFILNSGRTLYQFNAGTMTARTRNQELRPTDTLDVHPDDAGDLQLHEGERARVVSRHGEAFLPVRIDRRVRRGEVFATFHSRDVFLNLLTGPVRDRTVGAPEYKVTAVRIERAQASAG